MKDHRFVILKAVSVAALVFTTSSFSPAVARTTPCRERAINYCSGNWQSDGYANQNACITEVSARECSGGSGEPPGDGGSPPPVCLAPSIAECHFFYDDGDD